MGIILASASPRRRELLSRITDDFLCVPADIDEVVPDGIDAFAVPEYLARMKAAHVAAMYPSDVVIGSDTVVIADGDILGKPSDEDDARRMLRMLSGKVHTVVTGCAVVCGGRAESFSERTEVEFYTLTDAEIDRYVATGEPLDKAGAYGIQGKGCLLVRGIVGDYYNVMGLPVGRLYRMISAFGG